MLNKIEFIKSCFDSTTIVNDITLTEENKNQIFDLVIEHLIANKETINLDELLKVIGYSGNYNCEYKSDKCEQCGDYNEFETFQLIE